MFTDRELDILEFEIFPVVTKYNDLQKVFNNLDGDKSYLFLKGCEYEKIDTSKIIIGTFGREENNILYFYGFPKKGYRKYRGGHRPWSVDITKVITETEIILPKNCQSMFHGCNRIEELDVSKGITSKVHLMQGMFYLCKMLKEIKGLENGDVSNVAHVFVMFYNCENLKELDFSKGNTKNLKTLSRMFRYCTALEKVDVSGGNTSSINNIEEMFSQCESLKEIKGILDGDIDPNQLDKKNFLKNVNPDLKDLRKIRSKFIRR